MSRRRTEPVPGQVGLFDRDRAPEFVPFDIDDRTRIVETGLDVNLFVDAGAGSGKTTTLVGRIISLITEHGVDLTNIAAITFTEAAAAELRDRIRSRLETCASAEHPTLVRQRAERALERADGAAISTLHSFAQRLLLEHPIEAGVPPHFDLLDEVQSALAFDARWSRFVDRLLADEANRELITRSAALGIAFAGGGDSGLRNVARQLNANWDRLAHESYVRFDLGPIDVRSVIERVGDLARMYRDTCRDDSDYLAEWMVKAIDHLAALERATRPVEALPLLTGFGAIKSRSTGSKKGWTDVEAARAARASLVAAVDDALERQKEAVLDRWRAELVRFTLDSAAERRVAGELEFHDLLVLARQLLRDSSTARAAAHSRYTRVLIDEFQDTDPIQLDLALFIATDAGEVEDRSWSDLPVEPGRLCFVGDPKQSIYRFRRADAALFGEARDKLGSRAERATLKQNFRTVPAVLAFINEVFGALLAGDGQPEYMPLQAARDECPGCDHRVVLLGESHPDKMPAAQLRELEAGDVVGAIRAMMLAPDHWRVERDGQWEAPRYQDIVIVVPSRLSLPALEEALQDAGIPYRAEASALVFDTQEVHELVAVLSSIDDPADEIATVAALRSPLFGCGDDDLVTFVAAGGRFDYRLGAPAELASDHPVVESLSYLAARHAERLYREPSELLDQIIRDRRAFELALLRDRPRDIWRRLRFLVEQARQFTESQRADLRDFLRWVALQRHEAARLHEPLFVEADDDAVRITTIHATKGLEFPIVIVSGLTARPGSGARGLGAVFDEHDRVALRVGGAKTAGFDTQSDFEQQLDAQEKLRLLYVACTRARDHLVVSARHSQLGRPTLARQLWDAAYEHFGAVCRLLPPDNGQPLPFAPIERSQREGDTAEGHAAWVAQRRQLLESAIEPAVVAASSIARHRAVAVANPSLPGEPRGGTAFGRAVHGALQRVDLFDPAQLSAVARQSAVAEAVVDTDRVVHYVQQAYASRIFERARNSPRRWRELYVAAPVGSRAVEGFVDLLFEEGDELIVVDYKTDAAADVAADELVETYAPQIGAYALVLETTTGRTVREGVFLFVRPDGVIERSLVGGTLAAAKARVLSELTP